MSDLHLETDVLVVGGGPVGLALANELGLRGVDTLLVEQHERAGTQPRAKTTNVRTMEHMRRWGIAGAVRRASALPRDWPTDIVFMTRLFGYELAHFENAFNGYPDRDQRYSEQAQWIPQYLIEQVLRDRLQDRPSIRTMHGTRLAGFVENADGIAADLVLKDGTTARVDARYIVGADGARSAIREAIGARMEGKHGLAHHCNIILRIREFHDYPLPRRAIMYWIVNPTSPVVMAPMGHDDRWTFGTPLAHAEEELSEQEIRRRVHEAVGRPIDYEIVAMDRWSGHRLLATHYRSGRAFLAGDACHLHPPFGGFGMNMGIGDAVDLGWKLEAVLSGWGSEGLLDSYEIERRPIHERVLRESVQNYSVLSQHLVREGIDGTGPEGEAGRAELGREIVASKDREFHSLGVVLGSHYAGSPLVVGDGSVPPPEHVSNYVPSAVPGCLAPHHWLTDEVSLYDRFGTGFCVLAADPTAAEEAHRMVARAREMNIPTAVAETDGLDLRALYGAPIALIRPDQHVAWRGARIEDCTELWRQVTGGALESKAETRPMASANASR